MDPQLPKSPEEKRAAIEMETQSRELPILFERFLGTNQVDFAIEDDADGTWEMSDDEREKLSMIFHSQEYDAVNWALGSASEVKNRCFSERDDKLWRELILMRSIQRAIEQGTKESVKIDRNIDLRSAYPEVEAKSFFSVTGEIRVRAKIFDGHHPIFRGSGKYYELFQNVQPETEQIRERMSGESSQGYEDYLKRPRKIIGTASSESISDVIGNLSPDEAYEIARKIAVLCQNIQGYFAKKFGISFGRYDIASAVSSFSEQYPDVITRDDLVELQKEGKAPEFK